ADGLGGEAGAVPAARVGELGVEGFEVVEPQTAQRDLAKRGDDVAVDEPAVAVGSRFANLPSLARHPRVGQERADGDRAAGLWWRHVAFGIESARHGVGL